MRNAVIMFVLVLVNAVVVYDLWSHDGWFEKNDGQSVTESPTVTPITRTRYQSPSASQTVLFLDGNGPLLKRFAEETACSGLRAIQSADLVSVDADWMIGRNHGQVQIWHGEWYASATIKQACNIIHGRRSVKWKTVAK